VVLELKVYLVDKIVGKKGSWFEWKQWQKMVGLGLRILTDKITNYGKCR